MDIYEFYYVLLDGLTPLESRLIECVNLNIR